MRITKKHLGNKIEYLNKLTGNKTTPYSRNKNDKLIPNPGNYHLSMQYGKYSLSQMMSGGGVRNVFNLMVSKKELTYLISAYIQGWIDHKNKDEN